MYNALNTTAILTYNATYAPPTATTPTGVFQAAADRRDTVDGAVHRGVQLLVRLGLLSQFEGARLRSSVLGPQSSVFESPISTTKLTKISKIAKKTRAHLMRRAERVVAITDVKQN